MPTAFIRLPDPPANVIRTRLLPKDVVFDILDNAYYTRGSIDNNPDFKTLKACCLVSREFAMHAQLLLFRWVNISHKYKAHAFLRALAPKSKVAANVARARSLGRAVRIMTVSFKDPLGSRAVKISVQELIQLVQACPFLYELHIVGTPAATTPEDREALRAAAPVRALRMQLVSRIDRMFELLSIWPTIRFLELLPPGQIQAQDEPPPPVPWTLAELRIHIAYDTSGTVLAHLAPALRGLDVLALTRGALAKPALLALMSPVLRSLTLEVWDDTTAGAAALCPALVELSLRTNLFRTSSTVVQTLPGTITHFAFYLHGLIDTQRAEREARTIHLLRERCPRLRVVTCYDYLGEREPHWAVPFVRHCRHLRIAVRAPATGGGEAPVDFVPVKAFPRSVSVANFTRMAPPAGSRSRASMDVPAKTAPVAAPRKIRKLKSLHNIGRKIRSVFDP